MRVGIMGAGAVGCFVGGKLVPHVAHVVFVGRRVHGITLTGIDEPTLALPAVDMRTDPAALADCDVVLVTVKSAQTDAVGALLADVVKPDVLVVSLQNGVRNAGRLRAAMQGRHVTGGIVEMNVVAEPNDVFRRGTTGGLVFEDTGHPRLGELVRAALAAGLPVDVAHDFRAKQWTKLVINLTNALGAVSGQPTKALLADGDYRRILRAIMAEALGVLRDARIPTARLGRVPIGAFPALLGMPTPLFRVLARAQLRVDPGARSSMWQDLVRGRRTEVDDLNGEIVRIAREHGREAPYNEKLVKLVHEAEAKGAPNLSAKELARRLA